MLSPLFAGQAAAVQHLVPLEVKERPHGHGDRPQSKTTLPRRNIRTAITPTTATTPRPPPTPICPLARATCTRLRPTAPILRIPSTSTAIDIPRIDVNPLLAASEALPLPSRQLQLRHGGHQESPRQTVSTTQKSVRVRRNPASCHSGCSGILSTARLILLGPLLAEICFDAATRTRTAMVMVMAANAILWRPLHVNARYADLALWFDPPASPRGWILPRPPQSPIRPPQYPPVIINQLEK